MRGNKNNDGYDEYYLWLKYEEEKKKLLEKNLSTKEHEKAIKELARKLKI